MNYDDVKVSSSMDQGPFKLKRNIMYKFFNEPVDALDLRQRLEWIF